MTESGVTSKREQRREARARRKADRNALRKAAARRQHSAARRAARKETVGPKPWYLHWYSLVALVAALIAYVLVGGPRLNGRIIAAVLGENRWVQGVAGWLWFFTLGALYDRARAGAFGPGRGNRIAMWTAGIMLFVAWTIMPIGRGAGIGAASGESAGLNEAPGFALGLLVALPTTGVGYWLANRRRWRRERLERNAEGTAAGHAWKFGIRHGATGKQVLHPAWLRPDDGPAYAQKIRENHLVPAGELAPYELVYLENKLLKARRAPVELLRERAGRRRGKRAR